MTTILVISDSEWVLNDVRAVLTDPESELETLDDPRRALARVDELLPDVVIVDLQIQSMGGMAVIRELTANGNDYPGPRLVMLLDRPVDGFLAKRAGADAYVVKPFEAEELRRAIQVPAAS
jgi:DNA-binding response OmpR family regulator